MSPDPHLVYAVRPARARDRIVETLGARGPDTKKPALNFVWLAKKGKISNGDLWVATGRHGVLRVGTNELG